MSWTDERVSVLKKLWGEGRTAAEIAKELGGGVTRNAVIGKAHRLKLSNRVSPIQQNKKTTGKVVERAVEKKVVVPANTSRAPEQTASVKKDKERTVLYALTDLGPRMCRWPIGDPREKQFGFCGDNCTSGFPYCEEHARVAYQAAGRSRTIHVNTEPQEEQQEEALQQASA